MVPFQFINWRGRCWLRPEEATAFADDLERAQADLPVRSAWD